MSTSCLRTLPCTVGVGIYLKFQNDCKLTCMPYTFISDFEKKMYAVKEAVFCCLFLSAGFASRSTAVEEKGGRARGREGPV